MDVSKQLKSSNFNSEQEAFEYLVAQSQRNALKERFSLELQVLANKSFLDNIYKRNYVFSSVAIAASFVCIICSFYILSAHLNPNLQKMASKMEEETYFALPAEINTRGSGIEQIQSKDWNHQHHLNAALFDQNYDSTIRLFSQKEKTTFLTTGEKFYFALSLTRSKNGDLHKAVQLTQAITNEKKRFYEESLWLKALIHIKLKEYDKSKNLLNKLINNSNYQLINSQALLNELLKKTKTHEN